MSSAWSLCHRFPEFPNSTCHDLTSWLVHYTLILGCFPLSQAGAEACQQMRCIAPPICQKLPRLLGGPLWAESCRFAGTCPCMLEHHKMAGTKSQKLKLTKHQQMKTKQKCRQDMLWLFWTATPREQLRIQTKAAITVAAQIRCAVPAHHHRYRAAIAERSIFALHRHRAAITRRSERQSSLRHLKMLRVRSAETQGRCCCKSWSMTFC